MDGDCAFLFCLHRPIEGAGMGFGHVGAHDQNAVAVEKITRRIGARTETESRA